MMTSVPDSLELTKSAPKLCLNRGMTWRRAAAIPLALIAPPPSTLSTGRAKSPRRAPRLRKHGAVRGLGKICLILHSTPSPRSPFLGRARTRPRVFPTHPQGQQSNTVCPWAPHQGFFSLHRLYEKRILRQAVRFLTSESLIPVREHLSSGRTCRCMSGISDSFLESGGPRRGGRQDVTAQPGQEEGWPWMMENQELQR